MGLLAGMAANRMQTRHSYRTISRMHRRRTSAQDQMGMRQDFAPAGKEPPPEAAAPQAPEQPSYIVEFENLAQLRDQGVISSEEFEAKKKRVLGI
jgi:hypothetical protein